ncbi:MAG: DUF86 domain-containing protein [Candidatus Liptonbacteria bacterium]|nr:DUF86 domain-containing protein [Candidatus Liptonbacteria bacterium]
MSRETRAKIIAKLDKLDEYLEYLAKIRRVDEKTFLADYRIFGAAERYLQLAIEVLLDVGKLLVVLENLRRPDTNQDIFTILAERKVISRALLDRLQRLVGFRNILVHDYEKIDRQIVFRNLRRNLKDFQDFRRAIIRYLRGSSGPYKKS